MRPASPREAERLSDISGRHEREGAKPSIGGEQASRSDSFAQRARGAAFTARRALGVALCGALALLFVAPAVSSAQVGAPGWAIDSFAQPTNFSAVQNAECLTKLVREIAPCDSYALTATDVGAAATDGTAVTLADALPAGLTVRRVSLYWSGLPLAFGGQGQDLGGELCTATPLRCKIPATFFTKVGRRVGPDDTLRMVVFVTVDEPEPPAPFALLNSATVEGGGAPEASTSSSNQIDPVPSPFGFSGFGSPAAGPDGLPDVQAGAHPYELTTTIDLDNGFQTTGHGEEIPGIGDGGSKDVLVDLPLGFLGSTRVTPQCSLAELSSEIQCPPDTQVGYLRTEPRAGEVVESPIWNIVPERGVAAEFGYRDVLKASHVLYADVVPTPSGYLLRTTGADIPQVFLARIVANFYGDPAARDAGREPQAGDVPFFTNPADCSGEPLTTTVHMDSWQHPGTYNPDGSPDLAEPNWVSAASRTEAVSGCNQLQFHPTITATPETDRADSPTGLEVDLKVPQTEGPETLATPPLRKAVVTLPEGMTVNPSSANGLEGCSLAQIGVSGSGQPDAAAPNCPDASKIGSVELETPALPGILEGQIYVARQTENPFHSLLALYIVVDDPKTGVVVKLPGEVRADPVTGRLQTVVDDSPQFPFSELRTHFFGGQKAALRTPAVCGTYQVTSTLTPWSAPESGPPATPTASFRITQGAGGGACPASAAEEPNKPSFEAGTLSPLAGAYSPFVLKLRREDGSQEFKGLSLTLPPGLIGRLAGLTECSDAALASAATVSGTAEQASPSCPASSEVGTVTVGAGAGLTPYYATGHAYLAGPYKGAPLSLAVITPAVAGPYDLGDVVVRNALQVNPETTQITAVSDEIPHILQGIPLDVRSVVLNMDKPDFTLNPTSCEKKSIVGSLTSVLGSSAPLTNSFQVGACGALGFKPHLALSLKGSTKHAGHPALKAVLTYPKQGAYANIAKAQVNLPGSEFIDQGNLNKTCTKPVLLAGNCPATSIYGKVKAWTPLLAEPLEGPVYLVGGYGYKLPALVAELDGQIKVLLVGKVDSGKNHGIRNTFEAVPDAPVEKFELSLKGGPKYSLLENSEDLCAKPQKAIADFTAQSGRVLDLTPTITNSCKGNGRKGKKHKGKKAKGHKGHQPKGDGHGRSGKPSANSLEIGDLLGRW
jgi:hypothetical protein